MKSVTSPLSAILLNLYPVLPRILKELEANESRAYPVMAVHWPVLQLGRLSQDSRGLQGLTTGGTQPGVTAQQGISTACSQGTSLLGITTLAPSRGIPHSFHLTDSTSLSKIEYIIYIILILLLYFFNIIIFLYVVHSNYVKFLSSVAVLNVENPTVISALNGSMWIPLVEALSLYPTHSNEPEIL